MLELDVQLAAAEAALPEGAEFDAWVEAALAATSWEGSASLTVRLVDTEEGAALNEAWRRKSGPTNVLAFPGPVVAGLPPDVPAELGDLVICLPVVRREAEEQRKSPLAHLAHLVIHGTLHLRGFSHEGDDDARAMETLETAILADLGFSDPYEPGHDAGTA